MIKFYDTCSLLELQDELFQSEEKFIISNISLYELEQIKTSGTKDEETKWAGRRVLHLLNQNRDKYNIDVYDSNKGEEIIKKFGLIPNNDSKIIAQIYLYWNKDNVCFCTRDLNCKEIASCIGINTIYEENLIGDKYTGYKYIKMDSLELSDFYTYTLSRNENPFGLLINEYLLIEYNNKITDKYRWAGDHYIQIPFCKAQSKMFGKIIPKDDFQQIALDSLENNQITMLRGPAGSGKSFLAFGHMFSLLEQGKIDKIIVFCNTVATKGSAKLGYYPGSRTEKLLDSQIGNLLESKLGDRVAVERLIDDGNLVLLPMSDIRGYDTTGMNAAIYISEAQNLDTELMKLALQRIGEDSICIIDGDDNTQVDLSIYAGTHNGMKKVSKVFKDHDFYGEVELQKIYRSKIAELAQNL